MGVDLFTEPAGDAGQVALGNVSINVTQILLHLGNDLCTVGTAQRIGGEVADHAACPVAVLEAAVLVVGDIHAQIFLVHAVPLGGNVRHRQGAVDEALLDLVADHHVDAIREFVALSSDQGGLGLVDRTVEHPGIDVCQLLREQLLQLGEHQLHEGTAAADEVLVKTALALVDGHGSAASQIGKFVGVAAAQLVEGMAALVDDGVHGEGQVLLVVVGGDADVLIIKGKGVGMLGLSQAAVALIQAQNIHQILGVDLLQFHGVCQVQEAVVDLLLFLGGGQQGYDGTAELGEESVQSLHVHALFELVEQGVIGQHVGVVVARKLAVIVHDLLQIGGEFRKIALILGLGPLALGLGQQAGVGNIFLGGDADHLVEALPGHLHLTAGNGIQLLGVGLQIGDQLATPGIGGQLEGDAAEDLHGHTAACGGILGGSSVSIQINGVHGVAVGMHGAAVLGQGLNGFLYIMIIVGHGISSLDICFRISFLQKNVKQPPSMNSFVKKTCIFLLNMLLWRGYVKSRDWAALY